MPTMKDPQVTNTVVMISPVHFGFNPETALTNSFQHKGSSTENVQEKALLEFNNMVSLLRREGITVLVLQSRIDKVTPDSIFPNNWFTHHSDGTLVIYPMLAQNRREEKQVLKLHNLLVWAGIPITNVIDMTEDEKEGNFLEGTGSLVFDREKKVVFAMESPRTTKNEFNKWCRKMVYTGILFHAYDVQGKPIYHTNVTMNIGREFAIVCLESIKNNKEKKIVETKLKRLGKEIIVISLKQMNQYCGNVLEVFSKDGKVRIIMSKTAYKGFTQNQKDTLGKYGKIVVVDVSIIERIGGGSARCMLAEVFPRI